MFNFIEKYRKKERKKKEIEYRYREKKKRNIVTLFEIEYAKVGEFKGATRNKSSGEGSWYVVFFFPAASLTVIRIINELAFPR